MKKMLKIFSIFIITIIVILAALLVYLKINYPAEKIKKMVTPLISENTGRDVAIKDASVSIFPTIGFSLEGISISNTKRTIIQVQRYGWMGYSLQNLQILKNIKP